jgi:formylglycine-generating enzyme required for sulfatase activity
MRLKELLMLVFLMLITAAYAFATPEMVLVKAGAFEMGNTRNDEEGKGIELPVHLVKLTYDYYIGKYEVTFDKYDLFCNETGKLKPSDKTILNLSMGRGQNPVINVTWFDAIEYCNWLSKKEGLAKAYDNEGNLLDKNGIQTTNITQVEG